MALPLNTFIYSSITPDQVRHRLTDDGWSSFDFGPHRIQISRGDLSKVRAARELAQQIAAQAGFWDRDLAVIEAELTAAENAKAAETPGPRRGCSADPDPDPAPAPDGPDAPYGGDDPALDAKVQAVADMPETRRKPKSKDAS